MSVDLDELFDAMRQRADTVTLAGPEPARRLGRHRNRVRATMTVSVAIVLVAVGAGVAFRPASRHSQPPAGRPGPVPTVGTPVPLGSTSNAALGTDGDRAYAAWQADADGTIWVTATTLRDGGVAWRPRQLTNGGRPLKGTVASVVALPSVIVVIGHLHDAIGHLYGLDPATGALRWSFTGDDWVLTADRVTTLEAATGKIRFHDATNGHDLGGTTVGSAVAGRDDNPRVLGWATAADERWVSQGGRPAWFSDPHVVVVDRDGTANVWDTRTATRVRDLAIGSAPTPGMAVADGRLFMNRPGDAVDAPVTGSQHLRVVSVAGDGGTWDAGTVPGALTDLGPCGPDRFCAVTTSRENRFRVTAFDVRQRRQVWQAADDTTGSSLSTAGGRTLTTSGPGSIALYDAEGRPVFAGKHGVWLDPQHLLVNDPDRSGRVARWSIADRKMTPLGTPADDLQTCTSTGTRWVCVHSGTLTTWNVG